MFKILWSTQTTAQAHKFCLKFYGAHKLQHKHTNFFIKFYGAHKLTYIQTHSFTSPSPNTQSMCISRTADAKAKAE